MSHQCSCGRDLNNNYVSYPSAYANSSIDRDANASTLSSAGKTSTSAGSGQTQLTAKVMFGTVGAIRELREKEKSRQTATRAGDRRN